MERINMKRMIRSLRLPVALTCVLGVMAVGADALMGQNQGGEEENAAEAMSIAVPRAPLELLEVREFTVEKALEFTVEAKKVEIKKGFILALKVDLDLTEPLNLPDRYLLVGGTVAQRINSGYKDGVLVVVIPAMDLEKTRMWFGSRWLPRTFNARALERERESLGRSKIEPFTKKQIAKAKEKGGARIEAYDLNELWFLNRDLVLEYAPAERDMAMSLDPGSEAKAWRAKKGR